jgi:uncharacterized protein (TIGR03663 family)
MNRFETLRAKAWPIACTILLLFFGATRLYDLHSRPLHNDEGVNGIFLKNLVQSNDWKYDPKNYHGPTLFYFQLVPTWIASYINDGAGSFDPHSISGITPVSVRVPVALAGIFLLWLILNSWPLLGRLGAAAACVFAGLSCDMLFFSRYFIHETYMVVFTVMLISSAYRFRQTGRTGYAYIAAVSMTILFCTKETSLLHFLVLALAYICAEWTHWLAAGRKGPFRWRETLNAPGRVIRNLGADAPVIFGLCVVIWALLFSSFLTNLRGPLDSLRTYLFWGAEGVESGHVKSFFYYFTDILIRYETVAVIFGFIGVALAFLRNERKGLFISYWTLGMAGLYSFMPYKTPWLVINMILPMTFAAGYGVQIVFDEIRARLAPLHARVVITALAGVALIFIAAEARQTYKLNYVEYDNDKHPQVYAHTLREIFDLVAKIDASASRADGTKMVINIFSDNYWPLPLYLINYSNTRYWGSSVTESKEFDAPILIVAPKLQPSVDARLKDIYSIKTYMLRPGVPLALYVNTNLTGTPGVVTSTLDLLISPTAPQGLKPGLKLESFKGVGFAGAPQSSADGDTSYDFAWATDGDKKYQSPFSLRWTGFINIEHPGLYKFAVESDDGSWLTIDDTPVIDNGGDHPVIKLSRNVNLSAGKHKFELKYFDVLGGAVLHLTWAPPGSTEVAIPATAFFHKSQ